MSICRNPAPPKEGNVKIPETAMEFLTLAATGGTGLSLDATLTNELFAKVKLNDLAIKSWQAEEASWTEREASLSNALGFYANPKNYDQFGIIHRDQPGCTCGRSHNHPDMGYTAREALKG
jgi:hypothetical protein